MPLAPFLSSPGNDRERELRAIDDVSVEEEDNEFSQFLAAEEGDNEFSRFLESEEEDNEFAQFLAAEEGDNEFSKFLEENPEKKTIAGVAAQFPAGVVSGFYNFSATLGAGTWEALHEARAQELTGVISNLEAQIQGQDPDTIMDPGAASEQLIVSGSGGPAGPSKLLGEQRGLTAGRNAGVLPRGTPRAELISELSKAKIEFDESQRGSDAWRGVREQFEEASVSGWLRPPENQNAAEWFLRVAGSAVPSVAGSTALATVNPVLAAGVLAHVQGLDTYFEARENAIPIEEAQRIYALEFALSAMLEHIPLSKVKNLKGKPLQAFIKQGSEEGLQEVLDTVKSNLIAKGKWDENREVFKDWKEALVGGIVGGGTPGAIIAGSRGAATVKPGVEEAKSKVQLDLAQQASADGQNISLPADELAVRDIVIIDGVYHAVEPGPGGKVKLIDSAGTVTQELGPGQNVEDVGEVVSAPTAAEISSRVVDGVKSKHEIAVEEYQAQRDRRSSQEPVVPIGSLNEQEAAEAVLQDDDVVIEEGEIEGDIENAQTFLERAEAAALERIAKRRNQGRLLVGVDPEPLMDYTVLGAAKIARGISDFNTWATQMIADHGDPIKPHLKRVYNTSRKMVADQANANEDVVSQLVARNVATPEAEQRLNTYDDSLVGKKMSQFARRVADDPINAEEADAIRRSSQVHHTPQVLADIRDRVEQMTPDEKWRAFTAPQEGMPIDSEDNISSIAAASLMEDHRRQGLPILPIVEMQAQQLRSAAQIMRQMADVKNMSPETPVRIIEETLAKKNMIIPEVRRQELIELSRADIEARSTANQAEKDFRRNPTMENAKFRDAVMKVANNASRRYLQRANDFMVMGGADMFRTLNQGNLLLPVSQLRNITANVFAGGALDNAQAYGAFADMLYTHIKRRSDPDVQRSLGQPSLVGGTVGFGKGLAGALRGLGTGLSERQLSKGEISRGFRPARAWWQLLSSDANPQLPKLSQNRDQILNDQAKKKGLKGDKRRAFMNNPDAETRALIEADSKIPLGLRIKKLIEGSPAGIIAEINFRALAIGDEPFRQRKAESIIRERARLKGLKGEERKAFLRNPDAETRSIILEEAAIAVFQNKNDLSDGLNIFLGKMRNKNEFLNWADAVAINPQAPYKQTPINVAHMALQFSSPLYSTTRGAWYSHAARTSKTRAAKLRNRRRAMTNYGIAAVAAQMMGTATLLYRLGLIKGSPDEDEKVRSLEFQSGQPPRTLNVTGLKRALSFGDPSYQAGDEVHSLIAYGFFGIDSLIVANRENALQKEPIRDVGSVANFIKVSMSTVPEVASAVLEMTILQNAASMLDAITKGEYDRWFQNYMRSVTAVAVPNIFTAANRAGQDFLPDIRSKEDWAPLVTAIQEKNPFVRMDDVYPHRVGPLGVPIKRTPDGVHPWMLHVVDPFKAQKLYPDPVWQELGRLFKLANNNAHVLPPVQGSSIEIDGVSVPLAPREIEKLITLRGTEMRERVVRIMTNPDYLKFPLDQQIRLLDRAYKKGSQKGKREFLKEFRLLLQERAKGLAKPIPKTVSEGEVPEGVRRLREQQASQIPPAVLR